MAGVRGLDPFFGEHMNLKRMPHILIGGATGIALVMLAPLVISLSRTSSARNGAD